MSAWTTESFTNDLVFEALIRMHMGASVPEALHAIMGRRPAPDEVAAFDNKVTMFYDGWVHMSANERPWMENNRPKGARMDHHRCQCPSDEARINSIGTRFPCKICGGGFILGPGVVVSRSGPGSPIRYVHEIFRHQEFTSEKTRSIWTVGNEAGTKRVYIRCSSCGEILPGISMNEVNADGYVTAGSEGDEYYHGYICSCAASIYPYLEGWKEWKEGIR